MNRCKQSLQKFVLAVNRWPFGLRLTRLPYYLALRATAGMLRKYPLVSAAYVRNSFALGSWVPGRSDIDLTLILRAGEPLQSEWATVSKFWEHYAALQRWFPMLGEVEIISEANLDAWTQFSITGYEARYWLCIYGDDRVRSGSAGEEHQLRRDRLNHAIGIYRYQMAPAMGSAQDQVLVRYAKKILRYLDQTVDACMDEQLADMTREVLQASVVQELDRRVQEQDSQLREGVDLDLERTLGRTGFPAVDKGPQPAWLPRNDAVGEVLEAILESPNDASLIYYIPKEQLDVERLTRCIALANGGEGIPVVMTRSTLIYYLQFVDPLEYLALLQNRTLLWGSDPLLSSGPWPEAVFHHAVCAYSVNILSFPYTLELERLNPDEFRNLLLGWILRTARYFEDGVMEFDYDRLLDYWQRMHPESGIVHWQSSPDDPLRRFRLLRHLTDYICKGMIKEPNRVRTLL